MGENVGVSNPYAPPDPDRAEPREPVRPPQSRPPQPRPAQPRPAAPPAPPDPARLARAASSARLSTVLLLATAATILLPSPWHLTSLAFALAGIVVTVRGLMIAPRSNEPGSPGRRLMLLTVASVVALMATSASAVAWPVQQKYRACLEHALTQQAQQACEDDLSQLLQRG